MRRAEKVRQKAREIVEQGSRPSALKIAEELEFTEDDVHRCLNFLEQEGEVRTYTSEILGTRHRMVGISRD